MITTAEYLRRKAMENNTSQIIVSASDNPVPLPNVTRLEVIDDHGRVYSNIPCAVELSLQDQGRTLKVFVTRKPIKVAK